MWLLVNGLSGQQSPVIPPDQILPGQAEMPANPHLEKALKEYGKLIEKYPENSELLYNLGNLRLLGGDPENALKYYVESLQSESAQTQADALYNMGNTYHQLGDLEKSVELYKDALKLNPHDSDIRHNYELSKRMLEMQPPQQQQNESQEGEEQGNQDQSQQQESQQQENEKEGENEDSQSEPESGENSEMEEEQKQSNPEEGEEDQRDMKDSQQESSEQEKNDQSPTQQQTIEDQEKQLGKEEAEAILNAMKADQKNLKQKKYRSAGRVKLEKDW